LAKGTTDERFLTEIEDGLGSSLQLGPDLAQFNQGDEDVRVPSGQWYSSGARRTAGHHFFARPHERPRSHHVHVFQSGSADEFRHLAVRDFLRSNDEEAARYAAIKRQLAAQHPQDRLAYIDGKYDYITALGARAVHWARDLH